MEKVLFIEKLKYLSIDKTPEFISTYRNFFLYVEKPEVWKSAR